SRQRRVSGLILLPRPAVEEVRQGDPAREIEDRPQKKEWNVQIGPLKLQNLVSLNDFGPGPLVQRLHSQDQRQEQDDDHWQGSSGGFEQKADHHSPTATGKMMQHDDG